MSVHVSKAPLPGTVTELTVEWLSTALSSEWLGHAGGHDVISFGVTNLQAAHAHRDAGQE